jgi:sec-independent protein translocase protein TatB
MQIFGIGPLEFIFILVIMVLVLGPRGMVQAARETGKFIRKIVRSPLWRDIVGTSREIRNLPQKIVREAGIEKEVQELRESMDSGSIPKIYHPLNSTEEEVKNLKNTSQDQGKISSKSDDTAQSMKNAPQIKNPKPKHHKNP